MGNNNNNNEGGNNNNNDNNEEGNNDDDGGNNEDPTPTPAPVTPAPTPPPAPAGKVMTIDGCLKNGKIHPPKFMNAQGLKLTVRCCKSANKCISKGIGGCL